MEEEKQKMQTDLPRVITSGSIGPNDERLDDGFCHVSGRVQLAGGTVLPAIIDLNVHDSGEHWGTFVVIKGKLFDLHDKKIEHRLDELGIKIYPYKYNYDPHIPNDHHIRQMPQIRKLTPEETEALKKAIKDFETTGKIYTIKERQGR